MGYFPLDVINGLSEQFVFDQIMPHFVDAIERKTKKKITIEDDFMDFVFSSEFFYPFYCGKYQTVNDFLMHDRDINNLIIQGVPFKDYDQRKTEWRDLFGEIFVLKEWSKSKMVYKVDSDFFHEIKNTTNLKFSKNMLDHLPVNLMYFDLFDVEGIGDFAGAWVDVHKANEHEFLLAIYMVTKSSIHDKQNHAFFSYYCTFVCYDDAEIEMDVKEVVGKIVEDYYIDDFRIENGEGVIIRQPLQRDEDYRENIVVAILQLLEFLHADIEDISENPVTKSTYRPSVTIKNKFSEVRMWDVGIRYGKAIRFAQKQVVQEMTKINDEVNDKDKKNGKHRKPVRPHIRSAHWQRYHVGKGRKQIKVNWIPPTYVCGTKEIPVTIHKVSA